MNWYLVLRFLHIASTIVFIGGIFARQLVRALAEKTEDVRIFAALSQEQRMQGGWRRYRCTGPHRR